MKTLGFLQLMFLGVRWKVWLMSRVRGRLIFLATRKFPFDRLRRVFRTATMARCTRRGVARECATTSLPPSHTRAHVRYAREHVHMQFLFSIQLMFSVVEFYFYRTKLASVKSKPVYTHTIAYVVQTRNEKTIRRSRFLK